ncbi:MAG TPA: EcsC family protein, partial [Burkholderiaceae bacterium]|nr:EcsC family protein [Burkholderiaceae bacterium]
IDHFQTVARGHFAVRRLERKYGEAVVRERYGELAAKLG